MSYKVILTGSVSQTVVMAEKSDVQQVVDYLNDDERHGLSPGEISEVEDDITHESFVDWLNN